MTITLSRVYTNFHVVTAMSDIFSIPTSAFLSTPGSCILSIAVKALSPSLRGSFSLASKQRFEEAYPWPEKKAYASHLPQFSFLIFNNFSLTVRAKYRLLFCCLSLQFSAETIVLCRLLPAPKLVAAVVALKPLASTLMRSKRSVKSASFCDSFFYVRAELKHSLQQLMQS
jgi:hypothetical protein